jgi:hypothetical protein
MCAVGMERKDTHVNAHRLKESTAATMSPSDAPSFNEMRCHWHSSGALLLIPGDGAAYDQNFDSLPVGAPALGPRSIDPSADSATACATAPGAGDAAGRFAEFSTPAWPICGSPDEYFGAGNPGGADAAEPDWYGPDNGDDLVGGRPNDVGADAGGGMDCGDTTAGGNVGLSSPVPAGEGVGAVVQDERRGVEGERRGQRGPEEEDQQPGTPEAPVHDEYQEMDPHCEEPGEDKPYKEMVHRPVR